MFPALPGGVWSSKELNLSHEPLAHAFLTVSLVREPFL